MPDRIIRESAVMSESLASVSAEAERLFWRLTVVVDDYGRFPANPTVIKGRCLALVNIDEQAIHTALDELAAAGSIQLYEVRGKRYLCFVNWLSYQRERNSKPKFPAPPDLPQVAASSGEKRQVAAYSERREARDERREATAQPVAAKPAKRGSQIPEDFELDQSDVDYAKAKAMPESQIPAQFERFKLHHQGKGTVWKNWHRAWQTWVLGYRPQNGSRASPSGAQYESAEDYLKRHEASH